MVSPDDLEIGSLSLAQIGDRPMGAGSEKGLLVRKGSRLARLMRRGSQGLEIILGLDHAKSLIDRVDPGGEERVGKH